LTDNSGSKFHEEWAECRQTTARLDSILIDLRKYGFSIITGLLTAGSFLGFNSPTASLQVGVIIVTMVLIVILYWMDIYYQNLLYGAVLRSIFLEIFRLDRGLSKYISGLYGRSGMGWLLHFLYGGFFIAAFILGMFAATISENPEPSKANENSDNKINITSINSSGITLNFIGNNTKPLPKVPTNVNTVINEGCNLNFKLCQKYLLYISLIFGGFAMFLIFLLCDQVRSNNFKIIFKIMRIKSKELVALRIEPLIYDPRKETRKEKIVQDVEDLTSLMLLERLRHNIFKIQYKLWKANHNLEGEQFLEKLRTILRGCN
jgi:hypothetical protein